VSADACGPDAELAARQACRAVFGDVGAPLGERYAQLLGDEGIEWGLLGPREAGRIWSRHLLNSLALAPMLGQGACVVDVGSGAGLPGVPLAIARPDVSMVLLEPLLRRTRFLELVVSELGLGDRVRVVRGRAEDQRERGGASRLVADVVVCRAVAPLDRLLGWCVPLLDVRGELLALKGDSARDEVRQAASVLDRLGVEAQVLDVDAGLGQTATVVRVRRAL